VAHPFTTFHAKRKISQLLRPSCTELGYVIPSSQFEPESDESLPSQSSDLFSWDSDISVGVVFKKLFANMTSIDQVEQDKDIEPFNTDLWA